ncbi:hypothetical protein MKW98_008443, partial [Papaver atlanticum]
TCEAVKQAKEVEKRKQDGLFIVPKPGRTGGACHTVVQTKEKRGSSGKHWIVVPKPGFIPA